MTEPPLPPAQTRLVLVVDDDSDVLHSLKFSLETEGFTVWVYPDGQDLLNSNELPSSGCLVIDHDLPPTTGLDVLVGLRGRGFSIPAILITGTVTPALRTRAAQAGVPIIEKPFRGHVLVDAINNVFAQQDTAYRARAVTRLR